MEVSNSSAVQLMTSWVESSCEILSILLNQGVIQDAPEETVLTPEELAAHTWKGLAYPLALVSGLEGQLHLLIGQKDAANLVALLVGGDPEEIASDLSSLQLNVLQEALQQLVGGLGGMLTKLVGRGEVKVRLSKPEGSLPKHGALSDHLWLRYVLRLEDQQSLVLGILLPIELSEKLGQLQQPKAPPSASSFAAQIEPLEEEPPLAMGGRPYSTPAQKAQFDPLGAPAATKRSPQLDLIMDVPLQVQVVLGRTSVLVQDLISLGEGSILELDKLAGEPVELYIHDRLVAYGEVIVIDERFGVKVLELARDAKHKSRLAS